MSAATKTSLEAVLRDALTVAFLEGGDCAFTAYRLEIGNGEKIDVGGACDGYVNAALPHVEAAILAAMGGAPLEQTDKPSLMDGLAVALGMPGAGQGDVMREALRRAREAAAGGGK